MAKGYWIAHVKVTDPEIYQQYVAANKKAFDKYRGRFIVRGGRFEAPDAGVVGDRHVVIEFDSYDTALACYRSPEYQEALKLRKKGSEGSTIIVEGAD